MKKKNKTRDIIIVMAVATVIISIILIVVSVMSGKANSKTTNVTSEPHWNDVSDNIKNMILSSDIEAKYIGSEKRMVLYLVGSEAYYGLMYNAELKCIYLYEGEYTDAAITDALKISEATNALNTTSGYKKYKENVTSFVVNNAGNDGYFADGKIEITLAVDVDGKMTRNTFTVEIPQKEATE